MLEYAVKKVITNPTIITKSSEIIKIVDNRNHQTKAFILPISYAPLIEKLEKEKEYKNWVELKKEELKKATREKEDFTDMMSLGIDTMEKYLKD